jgi:hypothetical protein
MYVQLIGGLGNQLFIYATAYALMKKTGGQLLLVQLDSNPHSQSDYRNFMEGTKVENTSDMFNAPDIVSAPDRHYKTFVENTINYDAASKGETKLPKEYYQNFGQIQPVVGELKEMFMRKEFNNLAYANLLNQIRPDETAFMHIRRGDYLTFGVVDEEDYYMRALYALNGCAAVKKIAVLSDDIKWCRDQESKWKSVSEKEIVCVDEPNELNTLYIMMNCKAGAILSTSTFGMWGAMLGANENPSSCIIYPKVNMIVKNGYKIDHPPNLHGFPERWIWL